MATRQTIPVRVPLDVKRWLEDQAARNGSSQNSEVIRAIRERMERQGRKPPKILKP